MTVTREQITYLIRDAKFDVKSTDEAADAILALFAEQAAKCNEGEVAAQVTLGENTRLTARVAELEAALQALFDVVKVHPAMQDRKYIDLGIQVNKTLGEKP